MGKLNRHSQDEPAATALERGPGVRAHTDVGQPIGGGADGVGRVRLRHGGPRARAHGRAVGAAAAAGLGVVDAGRDRGLGAEAAVEADAVCAAADLEEATDPDAADFFLAGGSSPTGGFF